MTVSIGIVDFLKYKLWVLHANRLQFFMNTQITKFCGMNRIFGSVYGQIALGKEPKYVYVLFAFHL